jgi:hypothetical protein
MSISADVCKISDLLDPAVAERFGAHCKQKGFKKSSLAARLILDHLDQEKFQKNPKEIDGFSCVGSTGTAVWTHE